MSKKRHFLPIVFGETILKIITPVPAHSCNISCRFHGDLLTRIVSIPGLPDGIF
jgi:hypothetical protein